MRNLYVTLPAFNEAANIHCLVERWMKLYEQLLNDFKVKLCVVIIDDGSTDHTAKKANEMIEKYPEAVKLIKHEKNKGLGEGVKTALFYSAKNLSDEDFMCVMDCDNTQDPIYIFDLLKKQAQTNASVVIASRYQKGAKIDGVPQIRNFLSFGARMFYSLLLPIKNVRDYTCGYRLYKIDMIKKVVNKYHEEVIANSGFTCMTELLVRINKTGGTFAEIPFHLRYDMKEGESKMKVMENTKKSIGYTFSLRKVK